jgi:hypothetical protein
MIVFDLTCANDHSFEGWFASSADFERQQNSTQLNCPLCGNSAISKGLQAPYVNTGTAVQPAKAAGHSAPSAKSASGQYMNIGPEVARLIERLIANTEDVGNAFPEEARKIHYKEAPERNIRGNASTDEVDELRDEGIEVVAVPVPRHLTDKPH